MGFIELAEAIEVDHQQRERLVVAPTVTACLGEGFQEGAMAEQAGEGSAAVGDRRPKGVGLAQGPQGAVGRLGQHVERPGPKSPAHVLHRRLPGHQHYLERGPSLVNPLEQLKAVPTGQNDVGNDHLESPAVEQVDRLGHGGAAGAGPFGREDAAEPLPALRFVV